MEASSPKIDSNAVTHASPVFPVFAGVTGPTALVPRLLLTAIAGVKHSSIRHSPRIRSLCPRSFTGMGRPVLSWLCGRCGDDPVSRVKIANTFDTYTSEMATEVSPSYNIGYAIAWPSEENHSTVARTEGPERNWASEHVWHQRGE